MKTTRFEVKYNIPAPPASRLIAPGLSLLGACFPHFIEVDAVCAKDAVEAVLAVHPGASIIAVLEKCPVCEKKDKEA